MTAGFLPSTVVLAGLGYSGPLAPGLRVEGIAASGAEGLPRTAGMNDHCLSVPMCVCVCACVIFLFAGGRGEVLSQFFG